MEKFKIVVVGCGGIGSYLCKNLYDLIKHKQLVDTKITVYDDDTVDMKNLRYQNFDSIDIGDFKSEVLGDRFGFNYETERILDNKILNRYDIIISAVDGKPFRELLFKWAEGKSEKFWIDLRSEGRSIVFYTKHEKNTLEKLMKTLRDTPEEGTSCQLDFELNNGIIQQGNKIIATIGSQLLLNHVREEGNVPQYIGRF